MFLLMFYEDIMRGATDMQIQPETVSTVNNLANLVISKATGQPRNHAVIKN